MDIIVEQNITKFDIISTEVVNEFVVEVVQDIINFDINFAQLGEKGEKGEKGDFIILQDLPELP